MINPALLFLAGAATGGDTGTAGLTGAAGRVAGTAVAIEAISADSATVAADIPGSTGGGSGFRFSTTVGALVGGGDGLGAEVCGLSIVIIVGALTSDFVSSSFLSATVSTRSDGSASGSTAVV